jgi:hypothetical protein
MQDPTVAKVLKDIFITVQEGKIMPPDWWINKAMMLSALWQELKDLITQYEMAYKAEIADLIEGGTKIGQATLITEGKSENYKLYNYYKSRDEIVSETIKIAKIRAKVDIL